MRDDKKRKKKKIKKVWTKSGIHSVKSRKKGFPRKKPAPQEELDRSVNQVSMKIDKDFFESTSTSNRISNSPRLSALVSKIIPEHWCNRDTLPEDYILNDDDITLLASVGITFDEK